MKSAFLNCVALSLLLELSACASPTPYVPEATSENTTPEGLVRVENSRFDEVYVRPGFDLAKFDAVILAPVTISYRSSRPENELSSRQEDLMKRYFQEEMESAFAESGRFAIVDSAGSGTMRAHARISDLSINVPTETVGIRRNVVFVASSGEMTLEAEIYDAQSLQLLARIRDRQQSQQQWRRATSVSEWSEVRAAFRYWARIVRERIEAAHANEL